jgi:acetyltransferase-like isoleucine patch superfamily enzyme
VQIGSEVEIGDRAILLAGASVGRGARVLPAAVLSRRTPVPEGRTAAGVPAVIS